MQCFWRMRPTCTLALAYALAIWVSHMKPVCENTWAASYFRLSATWPPPQVPDEKTHPSLRAVASSRRPPCSPTRWSSTWPSRPTRSRTCPPTTSCSTSTTRLLVTSWSSMHWSMKALATAMLVFTSASLCWHKDDHNTGSNWYEHSNIFQCYFENLPQKASY